jgi:hypothetical protein
VLILNNINTLFHVNRKQAWGLSIPFVAEEFNNVPGTGGCGYILFDYVLQFKESGQKVWRNFTPNDRSLIAICNTIKAFILNNPDDDFKTLSPKLEYIIKRGKEHVDKEYWLSSWELQTLLFKLKINYAYFEGTSSEKNSSLQLYNYCSSNEQWWSSFMSFGSL